MAEGEKRKEEEREKERERGEEITEEKAWPRDR